MGDLRGNTQYFTKITIFPIVGTLIAKNISARWRNYQKPLCTIVVMRPG